MMPNRCARRAHAVVAALVVGGAGALAACSTSPTVPDLNLPSVGGFASAPTLSGANALVIGIVRGVRDNQMNALEILGQVAREGYGICASCGGLAGVIELPISPGVFFVEFSMYPVQYTDLSEARLLLAGLPKIQGITAQQIAGTAGFVQTLEAMDLTTLIFTRDSFGIVIAPNPNPVGPPGPVVSKAAAYTYILSLLDSGYANLNNGGAAFTFGLPPGFTGFNTPSTFAQVNRALRARIDIHTATMRRPSRILPRRSYRLLPRCRLG